MNGTWVLLRCARTHALNSACVARCSKIPEKCRVNLLLLTPWSLLGTLQTLVTNTPVAAWPDLLPYRNVGGLARQIGTYTAWRYRRRVLCEDDDDATTRVAFCRREDAYFSLGSCVSDVSIRDSVCLSVWVNYHRIFCFKGQKGSLDPGIPSLVQGQHQKTLSVYPRCGLRLHS